MNHNSWKREKSKVFHHFRSAFTKSGRCETFILISWLLNSSFFNFFFARFHSGSTLFLFYESRPPPPKKKKMEATGWRGGIISIYQLKLANLQPAKSWLLNSQTLFLNRNSDCPGSWLSSKLPNAKRLRPTIV